MKNKITIDKLIATQLESVPPPPPPDADRLWADMTERLDAELGLGAASLDNETASGPSSAAMMRGISWMTIAAYLLSGLLGAGALYALSAEYGLLMKAGSKADDRRERPHGSSSAAKSEASVAPAPTVAGRVGTPADEPTASAAATADRPTLAHTRAKTATQISAPTAAGQSLSPSSRVAMGTRAAVTDKLGQLPPSAPSRTAEVAAPGDRSAVQAAVATTDSDLLTAAAAVPQGTLATTPDGVSFLAGQTDPRRAAVPLSLLPMSAAWLYAPPADLDAAPLVTNRWKSNQVRGLMLYAGSSLGPTPRRYQNFTPKFSYFNMGVAYRLPVSKRWSIQPELWFLQQETPRISVATESRYDLDGQRWLAYDTLSVMRMQGLGLHLLATTELRGGIVLLGGAQLAWLPRAMQEVSYSLESAVTGSGGRGSSFSYRFTPSPEWLAAWQPGIKLGLEKIFWRKATLGINVYQGLRDITQLPSSNAPANYSRTWVAYIGYRL